MGPRALTWTLRRWSASGVSRNRPDRRGGRVVNKRPMSRPRHACDDRVQSGFFREVAGCGADLDAVGRPQFRGQRFRARGPAWPRDEVQALSCELARKGLADPLRGAGDQRDRAVAVCESGAPLRINYIAHPSEWAGRDDRRRYPRAGPPGRRRSGPILSDTTTA
jgi:hypothetical protein